MIDVLLACVFIWSSSTLCCSLDPLWDLFLGVSAMGWATATRGVRWTTGCNFLRRKSRWWVDGYIEDYAVSCEKKKLSCICLCVQVESSSFTAMATARSGPRGSSTGSRGYGGTGVFLPRAVSNVLTQCLLIILWTGTMCGLPALAFMLLCLYHGLVWSWWRTGPP